MELILTSPPVAARLPWRVARLEWAALGGAKRGWMQAALPAELRPLGTALCESLLGQPLTVIDADGAPCWWGYAHAITLRADELAQRLAMDGLANRAACLYPQPGGGWAQTAWAEDALSVERWGPHEHLLRCAGGQAEALAARDALLAMDAQPRWTAANSPARGEEGSLAIEARGWWETLGWRYYAPGGGRAEHPTVHGAGLPLGAGTGNTRVAQSFRLDGESWAAGEAWLRVGKRGAPADGLRLELCADAGGVPGALLASSEVGAAAVPYAAGWLRFALDTPTLSTDTPYWLALGRTGAPDAANYFTWQADEEQGYPRGECRLWDGATWSVRQPPADLGFRVEGAQPVAELIAALVAQDPWLDGVRCEDALSQTVLRWRDGRRICLEELQEALAAGGLLGGVAPDRALSVRLRPPQGAFEAYLRGGAVMELNGRAWPASRDLAGRWVKAGEALVWVEKAAWEDGRVRIEG